MRSRCRPTAFPICLACLGVLLAVLAPTGPAWAQAGSEALLERARALTEAHRYLEAERVCAEALKQCEAAGDASRLPLYRCQNQLADVQTCLHKFRDAQTRLAANREALQQLIAQHPDAALRFELARTCELQASCVHKTGRGADVLAPLHEAIDLVQKLSAEDPARPDYREMLVRALATYGDNLMLLARFQESETAYEEALRVGRKLVADVPSAAKAAEELAKACYSYALFVGDAGQPARAADLVREEIRLLARLESAFPDHPEYWHRLPGLYRNLAQSRGPRRNEAEAAAARREADRIEAFLVRLPESARTWLTEEDRIRISLQNQEPGPPTDPQAEADRRAEPWERAAREHADVPLFQLEFLTVKSFLALHLLNAGLKESALRALREGREGYEKLAAQFPEVPLYRVRLAESCSLNGLTNLVYGDSAEGERSVQQAREIYDKLTREFPNDPQFRYSSGRALMKVAQTLKDQADLAGAHRYFLPSLEVVQQLSKDFPKCPKYRRDAADTTIALGHLLLKEGDAARAEARFREGVQLWRQVVADFPGHPAFPLALAAGLANLSGYLDQNERQKESMSLCLELINLRDRLARDPPQEAAYRAALASDYIQHGRLLDRQEQLPAVADFYSRAVVWLELALQLDPHQHDWVNRLKLLFEDRAHVYQRLGRQAEHDADMRRAQELDESLQPAVMRLSRIGQRLAEGQAPRAMKEAEDLFVQGTLSGSQWYELAGLYVRAVVTSPDAGPKDGLAARAVESLRRACEQGYAANTPLAEDAQFHILATRPDFQKLAGVVPR
jgi:tetratricopeptide (TPR) repeat protein